MSQFEEVMNETSKNLKRFFTKLKKNLRSMDLGQVKNIGENKIEFDVIKKNYNTATTSCILQECQDNQYPYFFVFLFKSICVCLIYQISVQTTYGDLLHSVPS